MKRLNTHGDRVTRLKELEPAMRDVKAELTELVVIINQTFPEAEFRARMNLEVGVFSVRLRWRKGQCTFELTGESGRAFLETMPRSHRQTLLKIEHRRLQLNHEYYLLFAERRSLRKQQGKQQVVAELLNETLKQG